MNKRETRKYMKDVLTCMQLQEKDTKSKAICDQLYPLLVDFKIVALYMAMKNEVNLDELIVKLITEDKVIVVPKIVKDEIKFYRLTSITDVEHVNDRYDVREPFSTTEIPKAAIEAIIVPGVAFDLSGNRLGHGKGYYDKYLVDYEGVSIGVCFEEQLLDNVPIDKLDIKVQKVIYK